MMKPEDVGPSNSAVQNQVIHILTPTLLQYVIPPAPAPLRKNGLTLYPTANTLSKGLTSYPMADTISKGYHTTQELTHYSRGNTLFKG